MSDDGLSNQDREALQQAAEAVMQKLAAGQAAKDVVRDLEANGWFKDDAVQFVGKMEEQLRQVSESPDAQAALDIQSRFPEMRPIRSGPSLYTINGCGLALFGARDRDPESGTYVKTHAFCLIFLPILALGAYRVDKPASGEGWYLIGKVPLSTFAKWWNILVVSVAAGLISHTGWHAYTNSDAYLAQRKLAQADEALDAGDLVAASRLYHDVATSGTEHASVARQNLGQMLGRPELADLPVAKAGEVFRRVAAMGGVPGAFERGLGLVKKHAPAAPVDAARLLEAIAPLSLGEAHDALDELLDGPFGDLSSEDAVGVLQAVTEMSQQPANAESLMGWGLNWLEKHPQTEPRRALALLDLLTPLPAADLAVIDAARRRQWERIVADEPKNVEPAVQLALLLENEGDADQIETLLAPHHDKLGTGEGARLLGQLLAAKGEFDESHALLAPYLEKRLGELHAAEENFERVYEQVQERTVSALETGEDDGFNYLAYDSATEDQQAEMLNDYLTLQVRDDAGVAAARERLVRHATVVPVALDLGMVTLRRAENMTDADARQAELKKAEETFLAIQGMAGDTDAYRLHLGQVYYWLGKHDEGHELFEELIASHDRAYEIVMEVAGLLRYLGDFRKARQLLEEAYDKANDDEQRQAAAHLRSVTATDRQDKITWLERSDQNDPQVKANLCTARGDQAAAEASDDQAAEHYREALAIYGRLAETSTVFNNGGLVCLSLFEVTGDRESLTQGIEWFDKAIALAPGNSIVLHNSAVTLMQVAVQDLAGEELDLRKLRMSGDIDVLDALATGQDRAEQLRHNVRNHAGLAKALSYLDKAMVLAPKNVRQWGTAVSIHTYARDEEALQRLSERIDAAQLDLAETNQKSLEYWRFEEDPATRDEVQSSLARMDLLVKEYRESSKGPGFTLAVARLFALKTGQPDLSTVDADELVLLAEEAHQAAPSLKTHGLLARTLLFRASRALEAAHPEYAKTVEGIHRSLPPTYTIVLALAGDNPLGETARNSQDIKRAAQVVLDRAESAGAWGWALLRKTHPARADELAQIVADDQANRLMLKIGLQLSPASAAHACSEHWRRIAVGEADTALLPLKQAAQLGAPLPFALLEGVESEKTGSTPSR